MLAPGHAFSGLLSGIVTAPVFGLSPADRSYWLYVGTHMGFALAPDLDVRGSTADRVWGPLSGGVRVRLFGKKRTMIPGLWSFVRPFIGGHRRGTHSTLGLLLVLALVWLSGFWLPSAAFFVALGTGLGIRAAAIPVEYITGWKYRRRYWKLNVLASVAAGYVFYRAGGAFPVWVPWAMAGGSLAHVLGDLCTDGKVHLEWPFKDRPIGLPKWLAFRTGGMWEHLVVTPLLLIVSGVLISRQFGYDPIYAVLTLMRKI